MQFPSPQLLLCEAEGGRPSTPLLPPMRLLGRAYEADAHRARDAARRVGWLLGAELRAIGIDLAFSPVVDLDYGVSEIIGDRSFHRDPAVVAALGVALMSGLREAGMAATAKHFPGHGAVVADSHVALPTDRRELADLEPELLPYRRMIANGLPSIMAAHVVFPEVDPLPASLSARWINGILRRDLDFRGAVFADDLSMAGAAAFGDVVEQRDQELGFAVLVARDHPVGGENALLRAAFDGRSTAGCLAQGRRRHHLGPLGEPVDRLVVRSPDHQCRAWASRYL